MNPQKIVNKFTYRLILNSEIKKEKEEKEIRFPEEEIKKQEEIFEKIYGIFFNNIKSVECLGPERFLIVEKENEYIPINEYLTETEIRQLIAYFLNRGKLIEYSSEIIVQLENLKLNAIDSEFSDPKFIIKRNI
jgi:hypothetical protein